MRGNRMGVCCGDVRGIFGACAVLLAVGAIGHAWAASYVEIDITNANPTGIDIFGDILYVLDDDGQIYTYTWGGGLPMGFIC